jgi:L-fuculose-phosphate aldolase
MSTTVSRRSSRASGPDRASREDIVAAARRLDELGMNRGSTGNASVRASAGGFWITATGMSAAEIGPDNLVWIDGDGRAHGPWEPSSEWQFHRAIYARRPDLHAVLHTHSVNATALACLRRGLPAFHYMVAVAGGNDVPCTPYHLFGTEALSDAVAQAFGERNACLLANHGLVAGGRDVANALKVLQEVEALCEVYLKAIAVGEPALLTVAQMAEVAQRFRTYGAKRSSQAGTGR